VNPDRPALELLDDSERGQVLCKLLEARPELRTEAERLALGVLAEADRDTVAAQVQAALESVSTAHVAAISDRQRGGYVDHFDASGILLEEAVEPFLQRFRALAGSGHQDIAAEVGAGILRGLEMAKGDDECAIYFDEQFAEIHAEHVTNEIANAGVSLDDA
jgi:hypothetical protein